MIAVFPSYLTSGEACLFGWAFLEASSFPYSRTESRSRHGQAVRVPAYLNVHIRKTVWATGRSVISTGGDFTRRSLIRVREIGNLAPGIVNLQPVVEQVFRITNRGKFLLRMG